ESSDTSKMQGLQKGVAQVVEFTLSNPHSGLAIVDELAVEVLEVIEDNTGSTQTIVNSYEFPVSISPPKGSRVAFGRKRVKYDPGEVDRIILGVQGDGGYDYFVRVAVRWTDDSSSTRRETVSEPFVLRFPIAPPITTPTAERERLANKQRTTIEE